MKIKECILIKNDCYKANQKAQMTGIVVHDTAGGNKMLKRYVQPVKEQSYYSQVLYDLGINTNGNHWNRSSKESGRQACVHFFVGLNADGEISVYQTLPLNIACWGVGTGSKGSWNFPPNARIQFEICDDGYKSETYFNKAMDKAQELCAFLCTKYGWGIDKVACHHEAWEQGYGGNHSDIITWLKTFGKDMNWFRKGVAEKMKGVEDLTKAETQALIDANKQKVYHYYSELPKWYKVVEQLHRDGIFAGNGAGDMNIDENLARTLTILAHAGVFGDKYK